jgi:hypothetical protein
MRRFAGKSAESAPPFIKNPFAFTVREDQGIQRRHCRPFGAGWPAWSGWIASLSLAMTGGALAMTGGALAMTVASRHIRPYHI